MIGIHTEFECQMCGEYITSKQILICSGRSIKFNVPHSCKCGNKQRFRLLSFKPMQVELFGEDETVITVPSEIRTEVSTFANDKIKTMVGLHEDKK